MPNRLLASVKNGSLSREKCASAGSYLRHGFPNHTGDSLSICVGAVANASQYSCYGVEFPYMKPEKDPKKRPVEYDSKRIIVYVNPPKEILH